MILMIEGHAWEGVKFGKNPLSVKLGFISFSFTSRIQVLEQSRKIKNALSGLKNYLDKVDRNVE